MVKNPPANAGVKRAWQAAFQGVAKSRTQLSDLAVGAAAEEMEEEGWVQR